jgi:hypothetical protein
MLIDLISRYAFFNDFWMKWKNMDKVVRGLESEIIISDYNSRLFGLSELFGLFLFS